MKFNKYILILALFSISFIGCSKTSLKSGLSEIVPESPRIKTAVVKDTSTYNNDFEAISPYVYNQYVMALLLEAENPPDIPAAAEYYKLALQSYPNSYELRYSLASSYIKLRLFAETLEILSVIHPVDNKVLELRGVAYLQVGKQDSAKYVYEKLAQIDPNEPISYRYLSGFYKYANNTDSLLWAYKNLTRLLPFNDKFWLELGKLQTQKGEFQDAKESFLKSLDINNSKSNLLSFVGLAEMYKIEKNIDSALITYDRAIAVDSTNAALYEDITILYAQLDSLEQALVYAEKTVKYKPDDLTVLRRLGIIYYALQKYDLAETVFTDLVNKGTKDYINHFYLGRIAAQRKDYKIAVDEFKIMVQLNDSIPEHWMDLGFAYKKLGDLPNEIRSYQTGITKVKNDSAKINLLFSLGVAYEQNKMADSAVAAFKKIISLAPEQHQAMNYLGYMLIEKGEQLSYAKKLIEKALKFSPNNAAYLDSYGWLFYKQHKYKKAVKYLKQAAELQKDSVIFEHLGDAYYAKGDTSKAKDWWSKSLGLNPDNETVKDKLK